MQVSKTSLPQEGPKFSRLPLGFWRLADKPTKQADTAKLIEAAFELGITTFDHADLYGDYTCETLFTQAQAIELSQPQWFDILRASTRTEAP